MHHKNRPFRIVILGQNGVGKSALTVRFLTQRYIGDYAPDLENTYTYSKCLDGETVTMEIRDTAAQVENNRLEANIKWADAFVLVYSITDRCSFNECSRLKVLINSYAKSKKPNSQNSSSLPMVLVGNKSDRTHDRMISTAEGREKAYEMNCAAFYEISVREERDSASGIFLNLYKSYKRPGRRSGRSELQQRLSCPPSLQFTPELTDSERAKIPLRRRKALYTIS